MNTLNPATNIKTPTIARPFRALAVATALLAAPLVFTACATTQTHGEQLDDENLKNAVGRAMTSDDVVKRLQVDVDVIASVVYLRGEVDTLDMKYQATQVAQSVEGVDHVHNRLLVKNDRDFNDGHPDAWITTRITTKLAADGAVKARNIDVDTEDGLVTLSGIVENSGAWLRAEALALEVDGVVNVANELQISSS